MILHESRICKMETPVTESMMILIAGPYRSGTADDPEKMAENLRRLEAAAFPIFQKGHVPMIGEWAALPILHGAGGGAPGSAVYDSVMHPTAHRLLAHCDGVLRHPLVPSLSNIQRACGVFCVAGSWCFTGGSS